MARTAEAFMAGARCARENAVEMAREGLTPQYLADAGFVITSTPTAAGDQTKPDRAESLDQDESPGGSATGQSLYKPPIPAAAAKDGGQSRRYDWSPGRGTRIPRREAAP